MRPCMAATEARGSTPVQSPAAYTPRTEVRDTRSTATWPVGVSSTPVPSRPMSRGLRHRADREQGVRTDDLAPVLEAHDDTVGGALDRRHPRAAEHLHAPLGEDVLDDLGGVGVLAGEHPVARGDEHDLGPEPEVGLGELGTGDAGADDDEPLGQGVEVVDLLPREDALAVGAGGVHDPRVAPVATRTTSASTCSTPSAVSARTDVGEVSRARPAMYALDDDVAGLVELLGGHRLAGRRLRLEDDLGAALEVEAELGGGLRIGPVDGAGEQGRRVPERGRAGEQGSAGVGALGLWPPCSGDLGGAQADGAAVVAQRGPRARVERDDVSSRATIVPYRPEVVTTSSPTASEACSAWTCWARLRWVNIMKTRSRNGSSRTKK